MAALFGSMPAISHWYFPAALSWTLLLTCGIVYAPMAFLALAAGGAILWQVPPAVALLLALFITLSDVLAVAWLRHVFHLDLHLQRMRDMLGLVLAALAASLFAGILAVGGLAAAGLVPRPDLLSAMLNYWVGSAGDILALGPFFLIRRIPWGDPLFRDLRRGLPSREEIPETIALIAALTFAIWLVFGFLGSNNLLYVGFVPLVAIALRRGLRGATFGLLLIGLCAILTVALAPKEFSASTLAEFQRFILILSLTGLFLGVAVSERMQIEESLRMSRERYRTLVESQGEGIGIVDIEERFVFANPAADSIFGLPRGGLTGRGLAEFLSPEDFAAIVGQTEARRQGKKSTYELSIVRADGKKRVLRVTTTPQVDGEGRFTAAFGVFSDITDYKEATEALSKSETNYRSLIHNTGVGIATIDAEGKFTLVNQALCNMVGYSQDELVGKPFAKFVHPEDAERIAEMLREAFHDPKQEIEMEFRAVRKDGGLVRCLAHPTILKYHGEIAGFTAIIRDVTVRRRIEDALFRRNAILEAVRFAAERFLEADRWEECMPEVLARLGRAAEVGRVFVFQGQIVQDGEFHVDHLWEWNAPGVKALAANPQIARGDARALGFLPWAEVLQSGDMVYGHTRDLPEQERQFLAALGIRSFAVVPIPLGRARLGVIGFDECLAEREWLAAELDTVKAAASIIGAAIRRQQAEEESARQRAQVTLNHVIATVSGSRDLKEVFTTLGNLLSQQMGVPAGLIFSYDPDSDLLLREETWGLPAEALAAPSRFPATGSFWERAMKSEEVTLHTDLREVANFAAPWQSALCVPFQAKGKILGLLVLLGRGPAEFNAEQMAFYGTLGRGVGTAIENARLYEDVLAGRAQMQALSQRLVGAQEAERRRVARILHSETAQVAATLKMSLDRAMRKEGGSLSAIVNQARPLLGELITQVNALSLDLRPAMLDDLGLLPALLWYFDHYATQTKIRVHFDHVDLDRRFTPQLETTAYRIVQEILEIAAHQPGMTGASVYTWADSDILGVQIEIQGIVLETAATLIPEQGTAWVGARERTELLGGHWMVESPPVGGTLVIAELPLRAA
jgi:PAS domain S-box-containing protein